MLWVVCYDVPDDKRRQQVAKVLEGFGRRVQYSVFECDLDPAKAEKLKASLVKHIHDKEDDVRFYPLNQADIPRIHLLGKAKLQLNQPYYIV
jgi:CRISPR-associated protein Cas2